MHIAVIGADGFVGGHIITRLQHERVSFVRLDKRKHNIFDPSSLKKLFHGVTEVLHFAGANKASEYELFRTNMIGTLGVLEAMKLYCPDARILFASTSQVYSQSVYGASKLLTEKIIEWYTKTTSIRATILRFSNIYGLGCRPFYNSAIATFVHLIKNNNDIEINGNGEQKRDYIYIDDVIEAIWKAIVHESKKPCDIFDICSGKSTSINSVVDTLKSVYPGAIHVHYKKMNAVNEKIKYATNQKAQTLLGWLPKTTLKQGLKLIMNNLS